MIIVVIRGSTTRISTQEDFIAHEQSSRTHPFYILLGSYNVFTGYKRIGEARARRALLKWYKQISVLTGIEYILPALVFIISSAVRSNVCGCSDVKEQSFYEASSRRSEANASRPLNKE